MFSCRLIRPPGGAALSLLAAAILLTASGSVCAAPVSREDAIETAYSWLSLSPSVMHEQHGRLAGTATPVRDAVGVVEFYAVDLAPAGYVIIAADDDVEPVIAFSTTDTFDAAPGNPLYDMLRADLPGRLSRARAAHGAHGAKWRMLRAISAGPKVLSQAAATHTAAVASVNDVRVAPLTKSKWNQQTSYGQAVYNYYTPPYGAGNPNNYYSGCVATMLAQIMRFHQWPQTGVGTASYQITVNNSPHQLALRGGDGAGGAYSWAAMPLDPAPDLPASQQQAIGALLADAGVASNMDYEPSGSGADIRASVLTNVFHYAGAAYATSQLSSLEVAIRANLDAGLPVGLGITGGNEGHAVVADGYGYNAATFYTHLNMGWGGACNAWYNLPTVNAGGYDFNVVNGALFNIDPRVKGEVVSGRITQASGGGVPGVTVTLSNGSVSVSATTNAQGIYGIKGLASNTTWTVIPSADGWNFTPDKLSVTTGHSSANGGMGDKTGEDFVSELDTGSVTVQINSGAVAAGAQWRVDGGAWQAGGATAIDIPIGTRTLSFRPAPGWVAPASQQISVAMNQNTAIQVNYLPAYSLSAVPDNSADGQVSANPAPGDLGSYAPNTSVTLTATTVAGYYFGGWIESGTLVSTDATYTSVVKGARSLVASFPPVALTGSNTQAYVTGNSDSAVLDVLADLSDTSGTPAILSVTQPANGTVTINGDGTLTFTPGKGFHGSTQFSYTAGGGTGTITRTVTISNWFAASAGTYGGLSLATQVSNESSGYLKVTIAASGAFTGKLTYAGMTYPLHGTFDSAANYQKVIPRKDASDLDVTLHLDPASDVSGTVSDGVTSSDVTASRVTFTAAHPASQAGRYTALLSGNEAVPGNGYLLLTISPNGAVAAAGRLADGTPISTSACLAADGSLPYYAVAYKSAAGAGSILGEVSLQPDAAVQCSGSYAWFRPISTAVYYPAGFAETGAVTGSLVPVLAQTGKVSAAPAANVSAQLAGGGLASALAETGLLPSNGKIAWSTSNPEHLLLAFSVTGQMTGTFIDPATGKSRALLGVWLADQGIGGGFFLGENSAGALTLTGQ